MIQLGPEPLTPMHFSLSVFDISHLHFLVYEHSFMKVIPAGSIAF